MVWVISELYYPEETSTGYFLTRISEGLAERFSVGVLCGQPTYSSRGRRALSDETHNGVNIHRCWSTTFNKDVLPLRLVNIATITLSIFLSCLRRFRSKDCVIVVTNPPLLPFAVLIASRLCGSRCCLLIHDVYPEGLAASGIAKQNSLSIRGIGWFTQQLYKRAARIIVLGRDMDALVRNKLETVDQRIQIIPNWADVEEIVPDQRAQNPYLKKLGLLDKFVIQYSGNMGRTHGLECLIESAKKLIHRDNIHFVFIGWGAKEYWLRNSVKEANIQNITILPPQPRSDLSNSLNACDIAIISFIPGMAGVSVPSRMYNIMAAGKPIIAVADSDSELTIALQEENIGWVVPPNQPDKLVETILDAKNNRDRLIEMGKRARAVAESKYSFKNAINKYYTLIQNLDDDSNKCK